MAVGAGAVTPAAQSIAVGLSIYFSMRRSLFHAKWRSSSAAVLAYPRSVNKVHNDQMLKLTSTPRIPQICSTSCCISFSTAD